MSPIVRQAARNVADWVALDPIFQRALEHTDTHTIDDIWQGVFSGRYGTLISDDRKAGVLYEVTIYPRKKCLHLFLIGAETGNLKSLLSMQGKVVGLAKELGCDAITGAGRFGWEKVLPKLGYEKVMTVMEHKL